MTSARQAQLEVAYDPNVVGNVSITPGPFIPPSLFIPSDPETRDDGLIVQGAATSGNQLKEGAGVVFIVNFEIVGEIPIGGSILSLTKIRVGASASDFDVRSANIGQFGVKLLKVFPNAIFDMEINRRHNAAILNWRTKEPGINDTVFFRAKGEELFRTAISPLLKRTTPRMIRAMRVLLENELVPRKATPKQIREVLANDPNFEGEEISGAFIDAVKILDYTLGNRRHVVSLGSLQPNTEYEFVARSYDLNDRSSAPFNGEFNTRRDVDLRPLVMGRFEVQSTPFAAIIRWFTNRPSDTRYTFDVGGADTATEIIADGDGTQVHIVEIRDLEPNTRYNFTVSSRLTNADTFITAGLPETDATVTRTDSLMTRRAGSPLSFIGPPFRIVGTDEVRLRVRLNQPAALLEYEQLQNKYQWSVMDCH